MDAPGQAITAGSAIVEDVERIPLEIKLNNCWASIRKRFKEFGPLAQAVYADGIIVEEFSSVLFGIGEPQRHSGTRSAKALAILAPYCHVSD